MNTKRPTTPEDIDASRIAVDSLNEFVCSILVKLGIPQADAQLISRCMVRANLRGYESHGVRCLSHYVERLERGSINPRANIQVQQMMPWAYRIDGDNGMGHLVAARSMQVAIDAAQTSGIGVASARRSNHFGAASVYASMAIEEDCIGICMTNASPTIAPWGSREPLFGTNPISFAVPTGNTPAFVLDMATSTVARRKIREAMEFGIPIPEGWALDSTGRSTTNAKAALQGTAFPLGGAKGSALAMLIEILSGVLSGGEYCGRVLSLLDRTERESGTGHFFLAFQVEAFMPIAEFKARMDALVNRTKSLEPAQEGDAPRIAGERGAKLQAECRKSGVPLKSNSIDALSELGNKFSIQFPAPL